MLKVYLDNCVFNRPFDDQSQIRIRLETEAKFYIQTLIKQDQIALVWSYIIELEIRTIHLLSVAVRLNRGRHWLRWTLAKPRVSSLAPIRCRH